jgi:hypothetical protein
MYVAILLGVGAALSDFGPLTAVVIAAGIILTKSLVEIAMPGGLITRPSPYGQYVQNLRESGDIPDRPWVSYLIQVAVFYVPIAMIAYFVARYFVS